MVKTVNIDLRHVSGLAKLKIEEDKLSEFERQMEHILGMVDGLPEIEGKFKVDEKNVMSLRPDEIVPSLSRDEVLENAPQKQAGCIVVPKTVT